MTESTTWRDRLGPIGLWRGVDDLGPELARTVERLGYGTVWQGRSPGADLRAAEALLDATETLVVATGVVNIWMADAAELADAYHRIEARHPGRLLLGIGSGHREATPERVRPLEAMSRYLDVLDERGVPTRARVLSALGPKMLEMAASRSAGTHPYLTVPLRRRRPGPPSARTRSWRRSRRWCSTRQPDSARRSARAFLDRYLQMDNYVRTMRRGGFSDDDVADGGSDHLVDRIVVHGDGATLAAAVRAHLDAGADHVAVQVQPADEDILPALRAVADEVA